MHYSVKLEERRLIVCILGNQVSNTSPCMYPIPDIEILICIMHDACMHVGPGIRCSGRGFHINFGSHFIVLTDNDGGRGLIRTSLH